MIPLTKRINNIGNFTYIHIRICTCVRMIITTFPLSSGGSWCLQIRKLYPSVGGLIHIRGMSFTQNFCAEHLVLNVFRNDSKSNFKQNLYSLHYLWPSYIYIYICVCVCVCVSVIQIQHFNFDYWYPWGNNSMALLWIKHIAYNRCMNALKEREC